MLDGDSSALDAFGRRDRIISLKSKSCAPLRDACPRERRATMLARLSSTSSLWKLEGDDPFACESSCCQLSCFLRFASSYSSCDRNRSTYVGTRSWASGCTVSLGMEYLGRISISMTARRGIPSSPMHHRRPFASVHSSPGAWSALVSAERFIDVEAGCDSTCPVSSSSISSESSS